MAGTSRWRNRILLAGAAAVVLALVVVGMRPAPVLVDTAEVTRGEVVVTVLEDGRTRFADRYLVAAPLAGNALRIALDPGDAVTAGQIVARILPTEAPLLDARSRAETEARLRAAEDALRQAQASARAAGGAAEDAEREALRMEELADAVAERDRERAAAQARVAREQLSSARFAAEVAAHQVDTLRAVLGRAKGARDSFDVVAPVNGVVLRVHQGSEGPVAPGAPLLEIGDASVMEVVVDVLSADAVRIRPDAPVQIERWGGDEPLQGHVHRVEPSATTKVSALGVEEQRVDVIVHVDTPRERWAALGDGYRVEARIEVGRAEDVVRAPEGSLFRRQGGHAVFRVVDETAEEVPVELGLRSGLLAEIRSGLAAGDVVVVNPSDNVRDGVSVELP